MFILQFTCLCLGQEEKMLEHNTEERNKKRGEENKLKKMEFVSMSRERDVTANNLMWLNSSETTEQFSVQQQSCSEPGF